MAIFAAGVILLGFARTYYLKEFFGTPPLPWLVHLHGALMTAWLALFAAQTTLVEKGRTDIHRRLGVAGALLAAAIVLVGPMVAVYAVRSGHSTAGAATPTGNPLAFMVVPFGDIAVFAILVGAALFYRRRPQLHKRLMLVAVIAILPPGVARWPFHFLPRSPLLFFGFPDLVLIGCILYDFVKTRRLSPAFLWGGLLLIASHPLRLMFSGTAAWMSFAHWITGV
jgi:uncharacterized membrane protein YozB (DUF420 family)